MAACMAKAAGDNAVEAQSTVLRVVADRSEDDWR
jgi:hypothetical protein